MLCGGVALDQVLNKLSQLHLFARARVGETVGVLCGTQPTSHHHPRARQAVVSQLETTLNAALVSAPLSSQLIDVVVSPLCTA